MLLGLAATAADPPGAAAIAYLESLRDARTGVPQSDEPDLDVTAISKFVGKEKRLRLTRQITLLAEGLDPDLPFQIEDQQTDGELAAVLVRQWQQADPAGPRWFPLAMVLRDGRWLPAPAPGSFENAIYGYDAKLLKRARALERWLMRTRASSSVTLLDQQLAEMRKRMTARLSPDLLRSENPLEIITRFLKACRDRDMDTALALLGGLDTKLPENWSQRHAGVFSGFAGDPAHPLTAPWRLLSHRQAVRTLLTVTPETKDSSTAFIGCLDPTITTRSDFGLEHSPRVAVIALRLRRSDDQQWRIDLPDFLLVPEQTSGNRRNLFRGNWFSNLVDQSNESRVAQFPRSLQSHWPARPSPDHPTLARRLVEKLESGDFAGLLQLFKLGDDPEVSVSGHQRAAELWSDLHLGGKHGSVILLDQLSSGTTGAVLLHIFSAERPEVPDIRVLRTVHDKRGWLLAPALLEPADSETDPLLEQLELAQPRWEKDAAAKILDPASRLGGLPPDRAPSLRQARSIVTGWRQAIIEGNPKKALGNTAMFDNPRSIQRLLRALGNELVDARRSPHAGDLLAANQSGRWAAVSLRIDSPEGPSFPFYPVVLGDDGPRLLLEISLFHGGNRSRRYLNGTTWSRLADQIPEAAVEELRGLFDQHSDLIDAPDEDQPDPPDEPDQQPAPEP